MARLFLDREPLTQYKDRLFKGSMEEYLERLRTSATLYVGNVSFYTSEEQIWDLFSRAGPVKAIVMGLDKNLKTPCGFCFVEYHNRPDAERAVKYLNGTKLDDREVRMDAFDASVVYYVYYVVSHSVRVRALRHIVRVGGYVSRIHG